MNASQISVAELSRLNFRWASSMPEAVSKGTEEIGHAKLDLWCCHGPDHLPSGNAAPYLGKKYRVHVADW